MSGCWMTAPRERAGLARTLIIFVATLAVSAPILAVLNGPFDQMVTLSAGLAETSQANQGRQWIVMFWDALPFIIAILMFIMLLGAAAAERRLPGQ